MGRHAKPRRFVLVRRAHPSGGSNDLGVAGGSLGHELPEQGHLVEYALEATDTATRRRFLEVMRRQLVSERDLLSLLEREGWHGADAREAVSA